MTSHCDDLELVYRSAYGSFAPLVFLHPDETRDYTVEEFDNLRERDFVTRWLICCTTMNGKSIALRTHFSDNHKYEAHFKHVRNMFKAAISNNHTAAKTATTELLSMFFSLQPSQYYSFAVTLASGLSDCGENVCIEYGRDLLEHNEEATARLKLCLLMDIVFNKVATYRFLVDEGRKNTYKLVHCGTFTSPHKSPIMYAIFSFLLQFVLAAYVVAEILKGNDGGDIKFKLRNIPLATLTFIYSAIVAKPGMTDREGAMKLYGKTGPLQMLDFFVNQYLTVIILFAGFFVILMQEDYIEAVMNTAALLFIGEIDDHLPRLLGMKEKAIIKNYLIYQSIKEYERVSRMSEKMIKHEFTKVSSQNIGIPFCDYYLTNTEEQSSYPESGINYTPYQIRVGKNGSGHQIDASNFITVKCLIKEIIWSYNCGGKYTLSSKPRIGYLKIVKYNGEELTIIRDNAGCDSIQVSDVRHVLKGLFIITSFEMSNDISRLRICGSPNAKHFLNALKYYSLWGLSDNAKKTLERDAKQISLQEKRGMPMTGSFFSKFEHDIEKGKGMKSNQYYNFKDGRSYDHEAEYDCEDTLYYSLDSLSSSESEVNDKKVTLSEKLKQKLRIIPNKGSVNFRSSFM